MLKMAARHGDPTVHGGKLAVGQGVVLISRVPAARLGDMHICPMVTPGAPPVPHGGGPVTSGASTVLVYGSPAARQTDTAVCTGPPDTIAMGCTNVWIGGPTVSRGGPPSAQRRLQTEIARLDEEIADREARIRGNERTISTLPTGIPEYGLRRRGEPWYHWFYRIGEALGNAGDPYGPQELAASDAYRHRLERENRQHAREIEEMRSERDTLQRQLEEMGGPEAEDDGLIG